ncbi:hypothetical protein DFH06DRAFT_1173320 [Mycena polygramma]|nr:hypothetical protein DFH06DRAFT_1173320 [Mycena polygramma]
MESESNQSLRHRLAEIDGRIAVLQDERNLIQTKLSAVAYPVLTVPFDVISKIFDHCLPPVEAPEAIFRFGDKPPVALLLSQICRVWRDIAFKTPRLWAQFLISSLSWPKDQEVGTRRIAEWVERAGSAPLSFVLQRHESAWTPTHPPPPPRMDISLLPLSAQWRHVDLRLGYTEMTADEFHSALSGKLPSLHSLRIQSLSIPGYTGITAFQHAPSLRTVVLESLMPALILLPWAQLTRFTGEFMNGPGCLHVLRYAHSLVECKLGTLGSQGIPADTPLLPPHQHLEVLSLSRGIVCLDLLCLLTLPALRDLEFDTHENGDRDTPEQHARLVQFFERCQPPQRLVLRRACKRLVRCLPLLQELRTLEISYLMGDDVQTLLQALMGGATPDSESEVVLPHLRALTLSALANTVVDYGQLAEALSRRWHAGKLESFRLTWDCGQNDKMSSPSSNFRLNQPRLKKLVEAGLQISVVVSSERAAQLKIETGWI